MIARATRFTDGVRETVDGAGVPWSIATDADVDRHTELFGEAVRALVAP